MHNRIFMQFLWKISHNRFCFCSSTVQHIGNSAGAELDDGQTMNDLAKVLQSCIIVCVGRAIV